VQSTQLTANEVPSDNVRLELLHFIEENTKDERIKKQAIKCTEYEVAKFNRFILNEDDCVFETTIKETPKHFEERYLAKTYQGALNKIKYFCEKYECSLEKTSWIKITKRKAKDDLSAEEFGTDWCGEAEYNEELELVSVEHDGVSKRMLCDDACRCDEDYEKPRDKCLSNHDPKLPRFIKNMDLISYIGQHHDNYNEIKYAINMGWDDDDGSEVCGSNYCIPLDEELLKIAQSIKTEEDYYNNLLLCRHEHIDYVGIDNVISNNLPAENKKAYKVFMKLYKKFHKKE